MDEVNKRNEEKFEFLAEKIKNLQVFKILLLLLKGSDWSRIRRKLKIRSRFEQKYLYPRKKLQKASR